MRGFRLILVLYNYQVILARRSYFLTNLYFHAFTVTRFYYIQGTFSLVPTDRKLFLCKYLYIYGIKWNNKLLILCTDNKFELVDLRAYANYSIGLQAIVDFPTKNYLFGNLIQSAPIRTRASCMQYYDLYIPQFPQIHCGKRGLDLQTWKTGNFIFGFSSLSDFSKWILYRNRCLKFQTL